MMNVHRPAKTDLTGASGDRFFAELKDTTNGMLPAGTYRRMYKLALEQSRSSIIDIGVGQGASSIAFALGIAHSGRNNMVHVIDQFDQARRGPHRYSKKERPEDCREANTEVFRDHVRRYGVESLINLHPGRTDEVLDDFPSDIEADILSIDVDGHVDRDLAFFFDHIALGGWIVLDDYKDSINRNGRDSLEKFREMSIEDARTALSEMSPQSRRLVLGKHVLIFLLANEIEAAGAFVRKQVVGSTAFFVKTTRRKFREIGTVDFASVERTIAERFISELEKVRVR